MSSRTTDASHASMRCLTLPRTHTHTQRRLRAKQSRSLPALPLEAATGVAITLLKQGAGSTAEKIVDFMRKHVPYYAAKPRTKLMVGGPPLPAPAAHLCLLRSSHSLTLILDLSSMCSAALTDTQHSLTLIFSFSSVCAAALTDTHSRSFLSVCCRSRSRRHCTAADTFNQQQRPAAHCGHAQRASLEDAARDLHVLDRRVAGGESGRRVQLKPPSNTRRHDRNASRYVTSERASDTTTDRVCALQMLCDAL